MGVNMKEKDFPEDFPQKDKKRGERKAKFHALKEQAVKDAKQIFHISDEFIVPFAQHVVNSGVGCGCWQCQNPRKAFDGKKSDQLTMQEKRQDESDKYEGID